MKGLGKSNISSKSYEGFFFLKQRQPNANRFFQNVPSPLFFKHRGVLSWMVLMTAVLDIWICIVRRGRGFRLGFFKVFNDFFYVLVMFHHFLVMAATLFMWTSADGFAHHSVEVPFAPVLLPSFNHLLEFNEEAHIFLVFLLIPVRSGEFSVVVWSSLQTIDDLFGPKHPWFDFIPWDWGIVGILRVTLGKAFKRKHCTH